MTKVIATLGAIGACWVLGSGEVRACATCGCGDPTLTAVGNELPFAGRARLGLSFGYETSESGMAGRDLQRVAQTRLEASFSYAPARWLSFGITLPLVHREIDQVNLAHDTVSGTGDAEAYAKAYLYRDRAFAPHHLVAVSGGLRAPTAPERALADGQPMDVDLQTGTGSWTPLVGLSYTYLRAVWSFYGGAIAGGPTGGFGTYRPGSYVRGTVLAQLQPQESYALRLGIDARDEAPGEQEGMPIPDTGGLIAFASPGFAYSPLPDMLLVLEVRVPLLERLDGYQKEGPVFGLSAAYDL